MDFCSLFCISSAILLWSQTQFLENSNHWWFPILKSSCILKCFYLLKNLLIYIWYVWCLSVCMYIYHVFLVSIECRRRFTGVGITDICEAPYGWCQTKNLCNTVSAPNHHIVLKYLLWQVFVYFELCIKLGIKDPFSLRY